MALLKLGALITDIRGHVHGSVFSRSGAGNYLRNSPKPVNPRSTAQGDRRQAMSQFSAYWSAELDDDQRAAWSAYAAATAWTNRLGQSIQIPAISAFIRLNAMLRIIGVSPQLAAPDNSGHPGTPAVVVEAHPTAGEISLLEPGPPFDKSTTGHHLAMFQYLPANAGRTAIPNGPIYLGVCSGNVGLPPVFPVLFDTRYPFVADQRITIRSVFIDEQGRIAGPAWDQVVAADPI